MPPDAPCDDGDAGMTVTWIARPPPPRATPRQAPKGKPHVGLGTFALVPTGEFLTSQAKGLGSSPSPATC